MGDHMGKALGGPGAWHTGTEGQPCPLSVSHCALLLPGLVLGSLNVPFLPPPQALSCASLSSGSDSYQIAAMLLID